MLGHGWQTTNLVFCTEQSIQYSLSSLSLALPLFKDLPEPTVIRVVSTSNSSFELLWWVPKRDIRLNDGFRVRYCLTSAASCVQIYTEKEEVTVRGLDSGKTYKIDVRAQFISTDGRLLFGRAASASVTTWKDRKCYVRLLYPDRSVFLCDSCVNLFPRFYPKRKQHPWHRVLVELPTFD